MHINVECNVMLRCGQQHRIKLLMMMMMMKLMTIIFFTFSLMSTLFYQTIFS